MEIINTSTNSPPDTLGRLALYSGLDVLTLFEIKNGLSALMDKNRWQTYNFEMELQSPLLAMSLAGIPVDEAARREMVSQFTKEQTKLTDLINQLLSAIGYFEYYRNMAIAEFAAHVDYSPLPTCWDEWLALPIQTRRALKAAAPEALVVFQKALKEFSEPFNPVSPTQKLKLFYHFFGSPDNTSADGYFFPPPWLKTYGIKEYKTRNTKNEYTPAADRESLEKILKTESDSRYAAYWAAPFAHICLAISDLSKSLGFLNCKLEHGLFKCSFGAVTETGRLSSRQNAQGYGSNGQNVSPKLRHIFISPPGEKLVLADYAQIESRIVAAICYRLFGATNYLAMVESGDAHSLCSSMVWDDLPWPKDFTLDWTIKHGPFPKDMVKAAKKIASEEFYRGKSRRDVSKTLGHGCLTGDHEVLTPFGWVPIAEKPSVIMQWPGEFTPVSNWIDKEYTGTFVQWEGQAISVTMTADHRVYYSTMKEQDIVVKAAIAVPKTAKILMGNSYIGGSISEPAARLLAAYHCDGHWNGYNQVRFHFHKERKIERLRTLAGLAGVNFVEYKDETKFALNWKPTLHAPDWSMLSWDRESLAAYMDELPNWDGHFGVTSVSLFSKHRNWLELWQTFNRLLGYGGNIQKPQTSGFGTQMYKLQVNNRKLANRVSFEVDRTFKDTAQVYCPTVPTGAFYVRRKGRIHVTGNSNYLGRPPQMAKHSHIDIKLIEHYQSVYFSACPELPKWHQWVVEQVQTKGEIVTMLGRARRFFGRPNDDSTIREAVAYEPQSVAADYCNKALLRLHKLQLAGEFPAVIRLSKHDELVVSCEEKDEALVCAIMREQMEEHITITAPNGLTRDWFVPAEVESGWNMGRRVVDKKTSKVINPNGIGHPLDGRKRIESKGWENWKL